MMDRVKTSALWAMERPQFFNVSPRRGVVLGVLSASAVSKLQDKVAKQQEAGAG